MKPTWRKPVGVIAMLLGIAIWCVLVVNLFDLVEGWPILLQMPLYLIAGIAWIFPVRPLLVWMETGRWRYEKGAP